MPRHILFLSLSAVLAFGFPVTAQQPAPDREFGPVIAGFGAVFAVPSPGFPAPVDLTYKVRFDVSAAGASADAVNPAIDTLARFLNMHARAGVPAERMHLALVLHGTAGKDALDHAAYRARYGVDNPNVALLEALKGAGVRIYLCGQTAAARGLGFTSLASPVTLALSAMTVHTALAAEGYVLNPF